MANGLVIEQNKDGTATINFPGGGQHTVSGGNSVKTLQEAYGIDKIVQSDKTADQQKAQRDATYGPQEAAASAAYENNIIKQKEAIDDSVNINLSQNDLAYIDQKLNEQGYSTANQTSKKIMYSNVMLGLGMGLSLEQASDFSADGGFYTMLREGYADPNWTSSTPDYNTKGGRLQYLQRTLTELTHGVVGSNQDTRDWNKVMTSGDALSALRVATGQMYGNTKVQMYAAPVLDAEGKPTGEFYPPNPTLMAENGTPLRGLAYTTGAMYDALKNFGVKDFSWANQLRNTFQNTTSAGAEKRRNESFIEALNTIEPLYKWKNENLWNDTFATLSSPKIKAPEAPKVPQPVTEAPSVTQPSDMQRQFQPSSVPTQTTLPTVSPQYQPPTPVAPPTTPVGQPYNLLPSAQYNVSPMAPISGGFGIPTRTAGLGSVPQSVTVNPSYTGTQGNVPGYLTQPQQQGQQQQQGVRNVMYRNAQGATMYITEVNGQPMTAVPAGYTKVQGQAEGGMTKQQPSSPFTPQQKFQLLQRMGYRGPASEAQMQQFIEANPATAARFGKLSRAATKRTGMAKGGMVGGYQTGGAVEQLQPQLQAMQMTGAQQPTVAPVTMIQPEAAQFIPSDAGMTVPQAPFAEAATMQQVEQSMMPVMTPATLMQAATAAPAVTEAMAGVAPAAGEVSQQAQVQAAQQAETSVSQLQAAQGQAYMMNNPVQRQIQSGELITGAADAAKAAQFVEQIQAAEATPTKQATVQGQLETLMQQFEGGATPAWAAGAMRNAMATLSARGLGASSLAGQAVVQAAMESALPIAQIDAQTRASFESQNLSNRQQVAMFAAQQRAAFMQMEFDQSFQSRVQNAARIADVANMNFTAEQQVALENSRAANTMNLANLNNRQAMVMAEAAALSNLDMANLNNRQQAAVQNAQNFLQMDMANLGNEQQTALFRAQQVAQALFTDQAAENASRQFNATSENQTTQFFASLSSQVSQFNAAQRNAIDQYNIDQVNSIRRFNSEIQQQRDLFNAQNGLVIAQANAQWRQNLTTLNTAAQNEANRQFAQVLNNMSQTTLDQIWQRERDIMAFSFQQAENAAERAANVALAKLTAEEQAKLQDNIGQGKLMATIVDGIVGAAVGKWD